MSIFEKVLGKSTVIETVNGTQCLSLNCEILLFQIKANLGPYTVLFKKNYHSPLRRNLENLENKNNKNKNTIL